MARILSVSYDQSLLYTRQSILEQHGHAVVSAFGFTQALKCCDEAKDFSIFILGHSIAPARLSRSSALTNGR